MAVQIQRQLLETLKRIDRPGTFCTSGCLPPTLPGLEVVGLGPIALPLGKQQAAAFKEHARQAPYGKGTRTLVDTNVRRVWEIDAEQVTLANLEWQGVLKQAVGVVQSELGLENQALAAHLYKLLLYEPGSFFLPHRDGEKLDRMVATLVIALPSVHEGGELLVRHEGREMTVDFGPKSRFQTQFAAFYADCEHEIRPVRSGYRLALVYNLTLGRSKRRLSAPTRGEHITATARILGRWKAEQGDRETSVESDDDRPSTKLAVVLDHEYTPAGLAYDVLKGIDRVKADVLCAAARQAGCDAYLALVTKWECGSAEPAGGYGYGYGSGRSRRRGRYQYDDEGDEGDEGEHEMGEVFDESLLAEHFSDADGNPLALGQIPLYDEEIVAHAPLNEGKPDREDFEGYTGNAGMTLERWYHRAAIVLWPAKARFDVLCEAGVEAAIGGLEQMVRRWQQSKKSEQAALQRQCLEFASRIIARWPARPFASGYDAASPDTEGDFLYEEDFDEEPADFGEDSGRQDAATDDAGSQQGERPPGKFSPHSLLSLLDDFGDVSLIAAWIRDVLAKDASVDPGRLLGDICQQRGWKTYQNALLTLFDDTSHATIERHARLLADWSLRKDRNADRNQLCVQLAGRVMAAVERLGPGGDNRGWRAKVFKRGELFVPLTQAFLVLDEPKLMKRLVTYILERPKDFDLTTVQVPVLLRLEKWLKGNVQRPSSSLHDWLTAAHSQLTSRASHPPQEPTDWRRESATGCDCADCKALSRFLKDPNTAVLRFPMAQDRRQHVHRIIDGMSLDTTHVTEREGRPYTLVCTKTQTSYEHALKAHHVDLDHLEKLGKLLAWHRGLSAKASRPGQNAVKSKIRKRK